MMSGLESSFSLSPQGALEDELYHTVGSFLGQRG